MRGLREVREVVGRRRGGGGKKSGGRGGIEWGKGVGRDLWGRGRLRFGAWRGGLKEEGGKEKMVGGGRGVWRGDACAGRVEQCVGGGDGFLEEEETVER